MSTNRADLVAGITTMMAAFIAAQPTLLKRHFRIRPESLVTDWPMSYLDLRPVSVHYGSTVSGVRVMNFSPSIVFVAGMGTNDQEIGVLDQIVDAFTDHLNSYGHIVAGTVWSDGAWSDESVPLDNDTRAPAVRWTFENIEFKNGLT